MKTTTAFILLAMVLFSLSGIAESPRPAAKSDAEPLNLNAAALMKKVSKIKVGVSTRADVASLLGQPWRATNDADCEATQYGEVWEYLAQDASGMVRIHIAFSKDGKASLVARIPEKGSAVVLAFTPEQEHHH